MLAALTICGTTAVFTSCSSDDDNSKTDLNIAEKIIGKWMVSELEGQMCPTNLKTVVTFDSPTKAYGSLSDFYSNSWNVRTEANVKITGNKLSMISNEDAHTSHVLSTTVSAITDTYILLNSDWSILVDGKEIQHETYAQERWERVTKNYQNDIIGTWEGKVTSEEDEHTDGELHRWEYKSDGTYVYYNKVGGEWAPNNDFLAEYFVDGILLCTRWQQTSGSEELREWWEIESIQNGVMKWKALRMHEDGTTYTATFEMKKV